MIHEDVEQAGLEKLAEDMAEKVEAGDRFFLSGPLGSGKSTFARAFIRALGVTGAIPSPTFIMDSVYYIPALKLELHHMDLYRLEGFGEELQMLGFEEILCSPAVVLVEWPERIADIERRRGCRVSISMGSESNIRKVEIDWNLAGY